jgi:hypothetical protein
MFYCFFLRKTILCILITWTVLWKPLANSMIQINGIGLLIPSSWVWQLCCFSSNSTCCSYQDITWWHASWHETLPICIINILGTCVETLKWFALLFPLWMGSQAWWSHHSEEQRLHWRALISGQKWMSGSPRWNFKWRWRSSLKSDFLGNFKTENYKSFVEHPSAYKFIGSEILLKIHFLGWCAMGTLS